MFLTNNFKTVNNLMIYSMGECIPRVIPENSKNMVGSPHYWIQKLQLTWNYYLKNKSNNMQIDFTVIPYDNINEHVDFKTNNWGKLIITNLLGELCF